MHKNMLPKHGGVFMVKNTTYFWRRSFCGQKHQSSLGGGRRRCFHGQKHENTSSKRRKQLGLEEEVISYIHIDDKNMSVFSSSILTVEYISKNGAWPNMGRGDKEEHRRQRNCRSRHCLKVFVSFGISISITGLLFV